MRRGLGGEFADRLFAVGEFVGREARERVVEGVRSRRAGKGEAAEKRQDSQREDGQRERERALANGEKQSDLMLRGLKIPLREGERAEGAWCMRFQAISRRTCRS